MLRRERVFERDIFRFGTGTVIVLFLEKLGFARGVSIPYSSEFLKSKPERPAHLASIASWA